ncbi:MORN repeat-containing protein 3-like [Onthophagus taurus]|uniref:MORN repeat-containing protein 3-like n=1 Tax=Onthophagus taurus TaxID=166361 RepID=UPI000C1FDE39|nr:MORN repeat-containing protein 3-like [Onthophagus taurus]
MPFLKARSALVSRMERLENSARKNGWRHAFFTPFNDRYIGQWKRDVKEGKGSLLTRSGRLYEGDWERGYRHGFGVFSFKGNEDILTLLYRGDWKNGKMSGDGELHYPDGSFYKGAMKNSKRHGYGQMWYADGSFFDGDFYKDLREGLGLFVYSNGNRYEGFWLHDLKHGKGRIYHLDSGQLQEGVWVEDYCIYSTIEDIPFRQTSVTPTPYPVDKIKLLQPDCVCTRREAEVLEGNIKICDVAEPCSESYEGESTPIIDVVN